MMGFLKSSLGLREQASWMHTHLVSVGYRVPEKPLRFELWGAHEDLLPTETRPEPRRDSRLAR